LRYCYCLQLSAWPRKTQPTRIDGRPNQVSPELARGVFDFGARVDVHLWRFLAIRGEARDFYTGSPNYNIYRFRAGSTTLSPQAGSSCAGIKEWTW
jgi:hypothetical protein